MPTDPTPRARLNTEPTTRSLGRIGAFAPGDYICKCAACGGHFRGDKRAVNCLNCAIDALIAALLAADEELRWRPIDENTPQDGTAFLAYGRHTDPVSENAARGVEPGDHWWGIILWDVWRGLGWRFSKDGAPMWGKPTHFRPLPSPPAEGDGT